MAECFFDLCQFKEAEVELRFCVTGQETVHGPTHQATLSARRELCKVLNAMGRVQDAASCMQELVNVQEPLLGPG